MVALAGAACSSDDGEDVSADRPTTTTAGQTTTTAGDGDGTVTAEADPVFCERLRTVGTEQGGSDDPAALVGALADLADVAPDGLRDDVDVFVGVAGQLQGVDADDPAAALDIVLRPEVLAATEALETYASQTCGFDLRGDTGPDGGGEGGTGGGSDGGGEDPDPGGSTAGLDLTDVDAVKEGNAAASWPEKLSGTSISMDRDVQLFAQPDAGLTVDEALEACEATRRALVEVNPEVTVAVSDGVAIVVRSSSGGRCDRT